MMCKRTYTVISVGMFHFQNLSSYISSEFLTSNIILFQFDLKYSVQEANLAHIAHRSTAERRDSISSYFVARTLERWRINSRFNRSSTFKDTGSTSENWQHKINLIGRKTVQEKQRQWNRWEEMTDRLWSIYDQKQCHWISHWSAI